MFKKACDILELGIANLRGANGADERVQQDRPRRKRPIDCVDDGDELDQDDQGIKKSRIGDLMDTVKTAAEGVKSHSTNVVTWVKDWVGPSLRDILPASPSHGAQPQPSTPSQHEPSLAAQPQSSTPASAPPAAPVENQVSKRNSTNLDGTFVAPSTSLEWKTSKSDPFRTQRSMMGSKVCRRRACMGLAHREVPKTNGHPIGLPPSCSAPRLGRIINIGPGRSSLHTSPGPGAAGSPYTSMYEKTFPTRTMRSPSHSIGSNRLLRGRDRCTTAEESLQLEQEEIYRKLLQKVLGEQSSPLTNGGTSHGVVRSYENFESFRKHNRRLLQTEASEGPSEPPSGPSSPRPGSSQGYSNLPSPGAGSSSSGHLQSWSADAELGPRGVLPPRSALSPSALQDASSQDTQSSAHDGDCVIISEERQDKKPDTSSAPPFMWDLPIWIKDVTNKYDSRARERRRKIEETEAIAAQLQLQRLSEKSQLAQEGVELHLRVPLEEEVPLAPLKEEPKPLEEKPEFPDLTEDMLAEVSRAWRGGSLEEVLCEGFQVKITRQDLRTLSGLTWLNDAIINFYMDLLVERSNEPSLPSLHAFSTFFYPKLQRSGYSAVRRWTKKVDIFQKNILLVPVHMDVHWCLAVVDLRRKTVTYFDSMGGQNDEACKVLLRYLQQESQDKKGCALDVSEWTMQNKHRREIPQQANGSDCGMFTCKYAEYLSRDAPISFTQANMPYFRSRMVWEIIHKRLM